jgi:hypothetical protein
MQWFAKKTMATKSGDTLTETAGNDRIQQVENRHATPTKNKEIHHQAKTDGTIAAGSNIRLQAQKNIELSANQDMQLDITRAARIKVQQRDAVIKMDSGRLNVTAAGAIDIKGDGRGTITFAQNGAGFKMAPNGDITLFGNTVSLNADALNFSGPVNKQTTTPPPMPLPAGASPLAAAAIGDLDPGEIEVADNESPIAPEAESQSDPGSRQSYNDDDLVIGYEFHADEPFDNEDRFVLKTVDGSWHQEVIRESVHRADQYWLELVFTDVPKSKVFNLYYVSQNTSISPFVLLHEFAYADLS